MVAMCDSSAGEIVAKLSPVPSTKSPSMNSPYESRRCRMLRDSGAGAYSRKLICAPSVAEPVEASVNGHVVGAGVMARAQLLPLQQHVVQQARCAVAEQVGLQPLLTHRLGDGDEVLDRVLRGADATGRLDPDLLAGRA